MTLRTARLAIGTVQFGLAYGVGNSEGQVSRPEAAAILQCARLAGVQTLDTAIAYGESERRLGQIGIEGWRVITKLPAMDASSVNVAKWVRESVGNSLKRMKISRLYGLLMHRSADLSGTLGAEVVGALHTLKAQGLVEKVGVSIYSPDELASIWPRFELDLVQAPFNVVDRRLEQSGWLRRLHDAGVEVHTRSAFLQGLLLMEEKRRPAAFERWRPLWDAWRLWLDKNGLTPVEACLAFALSRPEISRVVIGVDRRSQLEEALAAASHERALAPVELMSMDIDLIDPSRWSAS